MTVIICLFFFKCFYHRIFKEKLKVSLSNYSFNVFIFVSPIQKLQSGLSIFQFRAGAEPAFKTSEIAELESLGFSLYLNNQFWLI